MFFLPESVKIFFCTKPTDMRCSFDGLYGIVKSFMENDPMSGALFVFRNRRGNRIKIFLWNRDGFLILYKKLAKGTFRFPPVLRGNSVELDYATMMMILEGIDLKSVRRQSRYSFNRPRTEIKPRSIPHN